MNWTNFVTYGDSYQEAFETLSTQLFERFLRRKYKDDLIKFRVINGAGGDGGIEAYGELKNGEIIAVQAKWFRSTLGSSEISQCRKSVETGLTLRKNIKEYYFCVPRALNSLKFGRGAKGAGKKPIENTEEQTVEDFTDDIESKFTGVDVKWWFEQDLELQIQEDDNAGIHKFWFDKELISLKHLVDQFDLQKKSWLHHRYIPELHGQGVIQKEIQQVLYSEEYRKRLFQNKLSKNLNNLEIALELIGKFKPTLKKDDELIVELATIETEISTNLANIRSVSDAILTGKQNFEESEYIKISISKSLLDKLDEIAPSNIQKGIKERLVTALSRLEDLDLNTVVKDIKIETRQIGRLFLGNSGTGKTHALSNTVDAQLYHKNSPAIIVKAKGTPCTNWTQILKESLELDGWDKNEILSGLETLSIRNDHRLAAKLSPGEGLDAESTKVILCIDGLEEDTANWDVWYGRMRESIGLMERYPRTRFIYTARNYFLKTTEVPNHPGFRVTEIPLEGDIPVMEVIDGYFSPDHFNIQVNPKSLIRGIDSLYALRLFCELYRGQTLSGADDILTAEGKLLNEKVNRIEDEFKTIFCSGSTRNPIREALNILAETFYNRSEIEHDDLVTQLNGTLGGYMDRGEIDKVLDFLVQNGFLIKSEIPSGSGILASLKFIYNITYQSIMELLMSEKFVAGIIEGDLNKIPTFLLTTPSGHEDEEKYLVNEKIVQNIVDQLFQEHGKLIGDKAFLSEGIDQGTIQNLRFQALIKASKRVAENYKQGVQDIFFKDYKGRHYVFSRLLHPAASSASNYFGAEFLHELLMSQDSSFSREQIWLGWDRYGISELGEAGSSRFYQYDLSNVIDPYGEGELYLSKLSLHNEYPLIYAWALATLDQSFRERLRTALMKWAMVQPKEFVLLLDKLINCKDPQILEDLASITLGLASKLKNHDYIQALAEWSLEHIFDKPEKFRNVIIRQGFRSVVERAYQYGLIDGERVKKARPSKKDSLELMPLDLPTLENAREEIYPIVHDLAWYVIKKSFDDFLEYENTDSTKERSTETKKFLQSYLNENITRLSTRDWAMATAIAYINSLGFSRTNGNGHTQATHGSKSKVFTLEEKYVWLAVHEIQGYLSDNVPLKETKDFIEDYSLITDIPNPSELINDFDVVTIDEDHNWVIRETLAIEVEKTDDIDDAIKNAVEIEPELDFERWLNFKGSDFSGEGTEDEELLAIYNYTSLHDSKEYISTRIDARAVIIEKGQANILLGKIQNNHRQTYFVERIDGLVASPQTDIYSNPSDVVWMKWISERETTESYYNENNEEKEMIFSVTSVTRRTVDGEGEVYIPSKFVRTLLGIEDMNGRLFVNHDNEIKAINHNIKSPNYDRQEMTLVSKKEFLEKLDEKGLEVVWFVDHLIGKNALNSSIKSEHHPQKSRKYFIHMSNGSFVSEKFWDARFSNRRDKKDLKDDEDDELEDDFDMEDFDTDGIAEE